MADPTELVSSEVPDTDNFHRVLVETEAVAHFSAVNKIREGLLFAMSKDLQKGGNGKRYIEAIKAISQEVAATQTNLKELLKKK